jgi:hypothetical protein
MITNRIKDVANRIINPYQSDFLPKRLISDNGWIWDTVMAHLPMVSVLLDQEKAYDRVHPAYLQKTLIRFGFPETMVSTRATLFFGTQVSISINGWFAPAFTRKRGLRQGDPLSPILFNLAFEPLLRFILISPTIQGIKLPTIKSAKRHWLDLRRPIPDDSAPLKLLSYADDLQVFLNDTTEWSNLSQILQLYGNASQHQSQFEQDSGDLIVRTSTQGMEVSVGARGDKVV